MELLPFDVLLIIAEDNLHKICMLSKSFNTKVLTYYDYFNSNYDNNYGNTIRKLIRILIKTQNSNYANFSLYNYCRFIPIPNNILINNIPKKINNIHLSLFKLAYDKALNIYKLRHDAYEFININSAWDTCGTLLCNFNGITHYSTNFEIILKNARTMNNNHNKRAQVNLGFILKICKYYCMMFGYYINTKYNINWNSNCITCANLYRKHNNGFICNYNESGINYLCNIKVHFANIKIYKKTNKFYEKL